VSELLFGRVVTLNIDGDELEGYDIDFDVERTLEPEPNKARIKVYNLEENIRTRAQVADARVALKVGYERTSGQIFLGDIRYVSSALVGPDWVTTIEAGDGEKAYRESTVALTWAPGKKIGQVVKEILETFDGVASGDFEKTFQKAVKEQFPRGGALSGQSVRVLDELVRGYGYRVSIQDGQFQFVDATGQNQRTAVKLTPDTGLIGEPELGEKDKKTGKRRGKVRTLIQPSILPGSVIQVAGSSSVKGQFVVQKVTHSGSNWQDAFYTDLEVLT
jgi:hypothetical protein